MALGRETQQHRLAWTVRGIGAVFTTEMERRHSAKEQASTEETNVPESGPKSEDVMNAPFFEASIRGLEFNFFWAK